MQLHLLVRPLVPNPQAGCGNMAGVGKVCLMKIPVIVLSTFNSLCVCENK